MNNRLKKFLKSSVATMALVGVLGFGFGSDLDDEKERAKNAAAVFSEIMGAPDHRIPEELLDKAQAIAVIPHVVKGAFIVGGKFGKGLISQRNEDGSWSTPSYIDLGGGSIGFQIGASATDYLLVFTNREGLEPLLKGKVKLGGDASVAAGPVGRTASAATDITLNTSVYSYSRSKGAFAGIALNGVVIGIDDSANEEVYGQDYSGKQILLENVVSVNEVTQPFYAALNQHLPSS